MGCDIHSVAQIKKDNKWITVRQDIVGDPRNYNTFGVLANVRNGSGFAGCDTGDGFIPIEVPKGFPKDFKIQDGENHLISKGTPTGYDLDWADKAYQTKRLKEISENEEVWMGEHSHSWHLLSTLEDYVERFASKAKTKERGYVSEEAYLKLESNQKPKNWCGGISGPKVVIMTAKHYNEEKVNNELPKDKEIYIQHEWEVSYLEATDIQKIIEELRTIAKDFKVKSTEVRYVFGFDS